MTIDPERAINLIRGLAVTELELANAPDGGLERALRNLARARTRVFVAMVGREPTSAELDDLIGRVS